MTLEKRLEDLKNRCENTGFKYVYGNFKEETPPPHIATKIIDSDNLMADNKVYYQSAYIKMDYTYKKKNIEEQQKIENEILSEFTWNKGEETYLHNSEVWQVSYYFVL